MQAGVVSLRAADYPDHAITMIVPFPPGGVADTVARPVAEAMARDLQQPVVIENKAGAGGGIGMAQAAKAKPDGYTVLLSLSSITVLPEADKILGRTPLYQLDQLKPIARFTADPTVFVVRADAPWKTLGRIRRRRARQSGEIHVRHVRQLRHDARADGNAARRRGYQDDARAFYRRRSCDRQACSAGNIDAVATGPCDDRAAGQRRQGARARAMGHCPPGRAAGCSEPSTNSGTDVDYAQWSGLFVPAGAPEPVIRRLRDAARAAANDERVKQVMVTVGSPIQYLDTPGVPALRRRRCAARWPTS